MPRPLDGGIRRRISGACAPIYGYGPSIDRREATTQVNIRDGETMVIGGVFIDTQSNSVDGIPYLSRVPVLGWLFKSKSESVAKQELLIFLTPNIVKTL